LQAANFSLLRFLKKIPNVCENATFSTNFIIYQINSNI